MTFIKARNRFGIISKRTQPFFVGVFFAVVTVVYLWFVVRPSEFSTRIQTLDSLFSAAVMEHMVQVPFDSEIDFWELGIFHPINRTICFSEPFVTHAIMLMPVRVLLNQVASMNFFIYFCWWTLAMAAWLCLRHFGMSTVASLWGGLFVAFCPDRAWHAAGHAHLYYASGLFLSIWALDKALTSGALKWKIIFALAFLSQVFAGIYMTAIVAVWGLLIYSAIIWSASRTTGMPVWEMLRRRGLFLVVTLVVGVLCYTPIVLEYMSVSKNLPENTLKQLIAGSATHKGYFLPPTSVGRMTTLSGSLFQNQLGKVDAGENSQYLGVIAPVLFMTFIVLFLLKWRGINAATKGLLIAVFLSGVICYVLSLGPFTRSDSLNGKRLPFAWLYAWFTPLHFFRAPSRFAYGVEWSLAILGAWTITEVSRLHSRYWSRLLAQGFALSCVAITMLDFYPTNDLYRIKTEPSDFSAWQLAQKNRTPYVMLPQDAHSTLSTILWDHVATVNGYSGYSPPNHTENLTYFEKHFPTSTSLCALNMWNVRRVFLAPSQIALANKLETNPAFKKIWNGQAGALFELIVSPPDLEATRIRLAAMQNVNDNVLSESFTLIEQGMLHPSVSEHNIEMANYFLEKLPDGSFKCLDQASILTRFPGPALSAAHYCTMTIKYRIRSWYKLREAGSIYFADKSEYFNEGQKIDFTVHADGLFHELNIPLSKSLAWVGQGLIHQMRIDLGAQAGDILDIESIVLH